MLPSPCTPADGNKILQAFCKSSTDMKVFGMTAVASKAFIQASFELFQPMIAEKAQKVFVTYQLVCATLFLMVSLVSS